MRERQEVDDTGPRVTSKAEALRITQRELEVLHKLALGWNNKLIARDLGIAPSTVGKHVTSILQKMRVTSRAGAAADAVRLGIIE